MARVQAELTANEWYLVLGALKELAGERIRLYTPGSTGQKKKIIEKLQRQVGGAIRPMLDRERVLNEGTKPLE